MEERQLKTAVREWLDVYKKKSVKVLSFDRLMIAYNLMCKYAIAEMNVCDIGCYEMQVYLVRLVEDSYSMSTVKKQFNLLTAYWKHALSQGQVPTPVYLGVKLPIEESIAKPKKEIETYTEFEQKMLLQKCMTLEKEQYGVVVLMLEAGLRIGEALALKWEDVLWNRKAVRIRRTLIRMSTKTVTYVQETPKSKTSKRMIPLSENALTVLKKLAEIKGTIGYIFAKKDDPSMPYSYSSVEFHVKALCKHLVINYKGLHAFRHTFATNCYERGCDVKILSKLLGHADVAITYNTYIHLYGNELDAMRSVIG